MQEAKFSLQDFHKGIGDVILECFSWKCQPEILVDFQNLTWILPHPTTKTKCGILNTIIIT